MMPQAKEKTVCFFCGDITRCGGTEKVSVAIANMLQRRGQYRVIFLSLTEESPAPFFPIDNGIGRYRLGEKWIRPGPGYLKLIPRLRRFLKSQAVDVIIDIDIVLDCLSIPAARGRKTRVISWEHFNYQFEQSVLYRRLILKYAVRRSDCIVTLTEADRAQYVQRFGRPERVRAIFNPMEEAAFDPGLEKEKLIVTAGRLTAQKGIDCLAAVAERVLNAHPDWKWILLGEGELRAFLEEEIRARRLEGRLIPAGNVQNVGDHLQRAQIYVMTSRWEGLPLSLLEAKAYGLPCVAFDVATGPAELIIDGTNGFLIPPFDLEVMAEKIDRLIGDAACRARFSENARLGMENYHADRILSQWEDVIGQLCG